MTWNHRIIKKTIEDTTAYEVHEVYYDKSGAIEGWAERPVNPFGETKNELRADLNFFLHAFRAPALEVKIENDKEILVEVEPGYEINNGHYFEILDRVLMMIEQFDLSVASHPVVRKEKCLSEIVSVIEDKLAELYQKSGELTFHEE